MSRHQSSGDKSSKPSRRKGGWAQTGLQHIGPRAPGRLKDAAPTRPRSGLGTKAPGVQRDPRPAQ